MPHRRWRGPDFAGDWAWGPPSGARHPGEPIELCAARELFEETGLRLDLSHTGGESDEWAVFLAEAPADAHVRLSSEHGRGEWLPLRKATDLIAPDIVRSETHAAARVIAPQPLRHRARPRD